MTRVARPVLAFLVLSCLGSELQAADNGTLRVQLKWVDQAQFAGFYVAEKKGHFADEGIQVVTLEGGPGIDPLTSLRAGLSDVAISTYSRARLEYAASDPIINVAQILQGPPLLLACRRDRGIDRFQDISGKVVFSIFEQDRGVLMEMVNGSGIETAPQVQVDPSYDVDHLIRGDADCMTITVHNEYRTLLKAGFSAQNLAVFRPNDFGAPDVEDGLYVLRSRLNDAKFVERLARLVRGLQRGWQDVRDYPAEAVDITLKKNPTLDRTDQQEMLESITSLLGTGELLYFEPARVESYEWPAAPPWTHVVWNRALKLAGKDEVFRRAMLFQVGLDEKSHVFSTILLFGFCAFALAATLDAVALGYDLWGRTMIALVSVMGGGIMRDLILTRNRLPFSFLEDPSVPIAITTVALAFSLLLIIHPDAGRSQRWLALRRHSEALGFSIITVHGALACILSGAAWYWAPFGAAMTVAGGGLLRDIIVNREPRNFRGAIYEEIAILSGLLLILGLIVANHFEHSRWMIHAVLAATIVTITITRLLVVKYNPRYPTWLAQPATAHRERI
jgi:NitT/TauT family transport system substrate-binding protein